MSLDATNANGLPTPDDMIELSMLMGNNYPKPFLVLEEDAGKQWKYLESLQLHQHNGDDKKDHNDEGDDNGGNRGGRLPQEDENVRIRAEELNEIDRLRKELCPLLNESGGIMTF
jgi:hypothetical protein